MPGIELLPLLCVVILPAWLVLAGRAEMLIKAPLPHRPPKAEEVFMRRRMTGFRALPAVLLVVALLAACSGKETEKPKPPPTEVEVQVVKTQTVPVIFEFVGQTESSQQ